MLESVKVILPEVIVGVKVVASLLAFPKLPEPEGAVHKVLVAYPLDKPFNVIVGFPTQTLVSDPALTPAD